MRASQPESTGARGPPVTSAHAADSEPSSRLKGCRETGRRVRDNDLVSLPREMTKRERSVVAAMLNAADLPFTDPDVHQVLVVEECNCGCPTIYFSTERVRHWPVAGIHHD